MFKNKHPNPVKALKYENKGDRLFQKGKYRKALAKYQKSESLNPERVEIYDKLIEALNQFEHEWKEEDFSNSMTWAMKKQELENPGMKRVHEKFSTEYQSVQKLVQQLMIAPNQDLEVQLVEQIINFGDKAHLPVLDYLLSIKSFATHSQEMPNNPEPPSNSPTEEL